MAQTDSIANKFTFTGENTRITYYTQAPGPLVQGQDSHGAQIEYQGTEGDFTFSGNTIQQLDSPLGTLLTVLLKANNDTGGLTFTLLLPPVTGVTREQPVNFETIAIKTASRGFIIESGATLAYEVLPLLGTASSVFIPLVEPQAS